MRTGNLLYRARDAVWGLLLVAFLAFAWPGVWSQLGRPKPLRPHPYASTDAYFSSLLGTENASERIRAVVDQIPRDQPLIFVFPSNDDRGDFVGHAVSYLTWPRQIRRVEVDPEHPGEARDLKPQSGAPVAIFCNVRPPNHYRRQFQVGPNFALAWLISEKS